MYLLRLRSLGYASGITVTIERVLVILQSSAGIRNSQSQRNENKIKAEVNVVPSFITWQCISWAPTGKINH